MGLRKRPLSPFWSLRLRQGEQKGPESQKSKRQKEVGAKNGDGFSPWSSVPGGGGG